MADKEFEKWLDEVDEIGRRDGHKHSIVMQTGSAAWLLISRTAIRQRKPTTKTWLTGNNYLLEDQVLKLNVVSEGLVNGDSPVLIPNIKPGNVVEYLGHLPGGNVKIRTAAGLEGVAHPGCFKELR